MSGDDEFAISGPRGGSNGRWLFEPELWRGEFAVSNCPNMNGTILRASEKQGVIKRKRDGADRSFMAGQCFNYLAGGSVEETDAVSFSLGNGLAIRTERKHGRICGKRFCGHNGLATPEFHFAEPPAGEQFPAWMKGHGMHEVAVTHSFFIITTFEQNGIGEARYE